MTSHPNTAAATIAGAITIIAVWLAGFAGVDPPAEVSSAFTTLIVGAFLLAGGKKEPAKP